MTMDVKASSPLKTVPMPNRIRALPRTAAGYPIPYFAATIAGQRDLRVASLGAFMTSSRSEGGLCWICGQPRRSGESAFNIGPMCAVNRVTQEPPSHLSCAEYAARVCPFLVRPSMARREHGLPEDRIHAGVMLEHNPGASAVWSTPRWTTFQPDPASRAFLFEFGPPTQVSWWVHGRPATRAEVIAAIDQGMPLLEAQCAGDLNPSGSRRILAAQRDAMTRYLPAEESP